MDRYTTRAMLDAEARIVAAARRVDAPTLDPAAVERRIRAALGVRPSTGQAEEVRVITTGGRRVVAVEGPAGWARAG